MPTWPPRQILRPGTNERPGSPPPSTHGPRFQVFQNAAILPRAQRGAWRASLHQSLSPQFHLHHFIALFTLSATEVLFAASEILNLDTMVIAEMCSSRCAAGSRIWTSDVFRYDFLSGKRDLSSNKVALKIRRSSVISAAVRSSSEATTDLNGRYSNACCDQPCAMSLAVNCPVNSDSTYNVERWVEESVHEIVKNIQEAPFLQYVFDSKSKFRRSQRQKIPQDNYWPYVRESLSKVDPDGVILVQKLEPGCASTCCLAEVLGGGGGGEEISCPLQQGEGAETNVWGVLVQARRGLHANNACYLLKTTRVSSSAGICTRYCLTRATCFGPSYVEQLENAWLF